MSELELSWFHELNHGDAIVTIKPGQGDLEFKTGARCFFAISNIVTAVAEG